MLHYTIIISIHFLMWHIMHACYFHSFLDVAHHDVVVEIKKSLQYCKYILRYDRYAVIIFLWVVFSEFFSPELLFFDPARIFFFLSRGKNANRLLGYRGTRRFLRTKKANANKKILSITPVRSIQRNWQILLTRGVRLERDGHDEIIQYNSSLKFLP